jgi:hypothetical protein
MKKVIFFSAFYLFATVAIAGNDNGLNGDPKPDTQKVTFQDFLLQFPKGSLPYTFSESDLQHQLDVRAGNTLPVEKPQHLGWEYYEFLPDLEEIAGHSSMPIYPEPVISFETEKYYAVVYNTGRAFAKQYKTYNVALFSKEGKHMGTYCIAGVQPGVLTAATLDEQLQVTIKEYQVKWEKNVEQAGVKGNTVTGINLLKTKQVDLLTGGQSSLTPYSMPTANRDTAVAEQ